MLRFHDEIRNQIHYALSFHVAFHKRQMYIIYWTSFFFPQNQLYYPFL